MPGHEIYIHEKERVESLKSYSILDTMPEEEYDNLTAIAAGICNTPISLVSLIDDKRQWFKSSYGLDATETPREHAFCTYAFDKPGEVFTVHDARNDNRFCNNPYVTGDPHVIFYAGVSLVNEEGFALGTLCVIDRKPRNLTDRQLKALQALSKQVSRLLELRKVKALYESTLHILNEKYIDVERFAFVAAHDLNTPVVNIASMIRLFIKNYAPGMDARAREIMDTIMESCTNISSLINELLEYSRSEHILKDNQEDILITDLKKQLEELYFGHKDVNINVHSDGEVIHINKAALAQILSNLVSNAIKYNDKQKTIIDIGIFQQSHHYHFFVKDNGPGIPEANRNKIFGLFEVLTATDRFGNRGTGIGLATIKRLIEKMGGNIAVDSEPGAGACFSFSIPA